MENTVLLSDAFLELSSEVFSKKEPKFLHSIIYIVFALLIFLLIFIFFGKMEQVVKAKGVIKPEENISIVKNILSGEIEEINYKIGEYVKENSVLLKLKGESLYSEEESINAKIKDIENKINILNKIIYYFDNNIKEINVSNSTNLEKEYFFRYKAFVQEKELLIKKKDYLFYLYSEELNLPENIVVKSEVQQKKYEYELAKLTLDEYICSFISTIQKEKNALKLELDLLQNQKNIVLQNIQKLTLKAPINGYVYEISSLNKGDYIFVDKDILKIVPNANDNMRAELMIPANKMGTVKNGMKVKMRFPAFPYFEYKGIEGTIFALQPDSFNTNNGSLYYSAYADLDSNILKNYKDVVYSLKSGLEVDARIVLEEETIFMFLLKKMNINGF